MSTRGNDSCRECNQNSRPHFYPSTQQRRKKFNCGDQVIFFLFLKFVLIKETKHPFFLLQAYNAVHFRNHSGRRIKQIEETINNVCILYLLHYKPCRLTRTIKYVVLKGHL